MGFEDLTNKVKQFATDNKDKVDGALNSDKAEDISDKVLGGVAGFANKITGDKFKDKIDGARDSLDDKIGSGRGEETPVADVDETNPGNS